MWAADEPFLRRLYITTRDDLGQHPELVDVQFRAQQAQYAADYGTAGHRIIELHGEPVGRLWLDRRPDEIVVVDMALVPDRRGGGIGGQLFAELRSEADAADLPLHLETLGTNRGAIAFAERQGFTVVADDGLFVALVREPV